MADNEAQALPGSSQPNEGDVVSNEGTASGGTAATAAHVEPQASTIVSDVNERNTSIKAINADAPAPDNEQAPAAATEHAVENSVNPDEGEPTPGKAPADGDSTKPSDPAPHTIEVCDGCNTYECKTCGQRWPSWTATQMAPAFTGRVPRPRTPDLDYDPHEILLPDQDDEAVSKAGKHDKDDESDFGGDGLTNIRWKEPKRPKDRPFIRFENIYVNQNQGDTLFKTTAWEPIGHKTSSKKEAVFDVVAEYKAAVYINPYQSDLLKRPPPVAAAPDYSMVLRSHAILFALRSVVKYYPEVNLSQEVVKLKHPYRMLVHHYDELRTFQKDAQALSEKDDSRDRDGLIAQHLGMLLDYLDTNIMLSVRAEFERHKAGCATWDMLWLLLRPGSDVAYCSTGTSSKSGLIPWTGAVVESVRHSTPLDDAPPGIYVPPPPRNKDEDSRPQWKVEIWSMIYDGVRLTRRTGTITLSPFEGEIELEKLEILPVNLVKTELKNISLRDYLTQQGKKFYSLLKPQCLYHKGEVLKFPFHEVESQVMVDVPAFYEQNPSAREDMSQIKKAFQSSGPIGCSCHICADHDSTAAANDPAAALFGKYDDILPETVLELTSHQYMLCGQSIPVYIFKTREWQTVDVSNLSPPIFNPKLLDEHLVLSEKRIALLKALASSFTRTEADMAAAPMRRWTADFVKGKGNSQIFLLHGPPGTGKTMTAECVAEYTKRPLMVLTSADVGITAEDVEENLEKNFKIAKKWGALLLIDEADIYLERRSETDLTRNSLVAAFLRALEIYDGILFLTTNRTGTMDDAFSSRIHIKLRYPPLSDVDRQTIWKNFMEKLKKDRGDKIKMDWEAIQYIKKSSEIADLGLNGREIRNIFQTAVGLAEFEQDKDEEDGKIIVKSKHLEQVVEMSGEFKTYLDDLWAANESKRAKISMLRDDDFDNRRNNPAPPRRR